MGDVQTLNDIYFYAAEHWDREDFFGHKVEGSYRPVSMKAFIEAGTAAALGLVTLGLKEGDHVALLSETRLEWAIADMAILTAGCVSVPIYPTLLEDSVVYVLKDSGAKAVVVSTLRQLKKVSKFALENHLSVVLIDGEDPGGDAVPFSELKDRGSRLGQSEPDLHRRRADRCGPTDLATIIYTSGTTGDPKGVMLTHGNITANVLSVQAALRIRSSDRCLSFLPLSHVLERMAGLYTMLFYGAGISYAESVYTVAANMKEVRPTVMISVPRFFEKMYAQILEVGHNGSPLRQTIFKWAVGVGYRYAAAAEKPGLGLKLQRRLAGALVFSKIKAKLGGRMRNFVSGGAPLPKEIAEFFHAVGLTILEGYGLTETSPVISVCTSQDYKAGTVGKPVPGVYVRIAEDGEILTKGKNVMVGYYNRPQETEKVLVNGWFHTGDVGHIDDNGFLVITDRKKDLIVTAGGKNVAPQPLESSIKTDPFIAEIVVLGDRRPYLIALVLPAFEALTEWAKEHGYDPRPKALAKNPEVVRFLKERIDTLQGGLASYETIKNIGLIDTELTIEGGELTPTLKVKRRVVQEKYQDLVESLYARP